MSDRVYVRKFDWDEAKRLRRSGATIQELADRFGVSTTAVRMAIDPRLRARMAANSSLYQTTGTCPECGGRASRNRSVGQHLCRECANHKKATSVRETTLQCMKCREWKPDEEFPQHHRLEHRRFRHSYCRPCLTVSRQESRRRRMVPCEKCGKPRSHPAETGGREPSGLCRDCWRSRP